MEKNVPNMLMSTIKILSTNGVYMYIKNVIKAIHFIFICINIIFQLQINKSRNESLFYRIVYKVHFRVL